MDHIEAAYSYSSLMRRVGDTGCYQWIIFIMVFFIAVYNSFIGAALTFFFLNPGFDCSTLGVSEIECEHYVCENIKPEHQYLYEKQQELNSLITEFGPFHCEQNYGISLLRSIIYAGTVLGFIAFTWYATNQSRKNAIIMGFIACISGSLMMFLAQSLLIASIGCFVIGIGFFTNIRFSISLVSEVTQHQLSQKFVSFLVVGFSVGSLLSGVVFGWLKDWRTVTLYFCLIYSVVQLIFFSIFAEDTPRMLLRSKQTAKVVKVLKKIAKINRIQYTIEEQQIVQYIKEEEKFASVQQNFSFSDILKFPSIRLTALLFFTITIALDFLFYSHYAIASVFGINEVINTQLMGAADILGVLIVQFFVKFIPRTKSSLIIYSTLSILSLATALIKVPANCEECSEAVLQLILVLIVKVLMNFQFALFLVHQAEFYPASVRVIGFSIGGFCGAVAQGICQIVMVDSGQWGINPFLIIMMFQILTVVLYIQIPETLDKEPQDNVIEMTEQKQLNEERKKHS